MSVNLLMFYISTTLYFKQYLIKVLCNLHLFCPFFKYDLCSMGPKMTTTLILQFINASVKASLHKISVVLFTVWRMCKKNKIVPITFFPDGEVINMQFWFIPLWLWRKKKAQKRNWSTDARQNKGKWVKKHNKRPLNGLSMILWASFWGPTPH